MIKCHIFENLTKSGAKIFDVSCEGRKVFPILPVYAIRVPIDIISTNDFSSKVAAIIPTKMPQNHVEYNGVCNRSFTIDIHLK